MKTTIKITNKELFYGRNVEVNTLSLSSLYDGQCSGSITIYFNDEEEQHDGEFSATDFENEFGFVLTQFK
jgi:hypothetical protein